MSHEQSQNSSGFRPEYALPENQAMAELTMVNDYAARFPESSALVSDALATLQNATGNHVPRFKYKGSLGGDEADILDAPLDRHGYLPEGGMDLVFSKLTLIMPRRITDEGHGMSDAERQIAGATAHGTIVVGEMPPETHSLLEGLYGLTGSRLVSEYVRGDQEGDRFGRVIVRQGTYNGRQVNFIERHDRWGESVYGGQTAMSVEVASDGIADREIAEAMAANFRKTAELPQGHPHAASPRSGLVAGIIAGAKKRLRGGGRGGNKKP